MHHSHQTVLNEIVSNGKINSAINLGNPILAQNHQGELPGFSVALIKAPAKELGIDYQFHTFDAAGKVFIALADKVWQVAFLAIEPISADQLAFSQPYVTLQSTYLIKTDSPYQSVTELDKANAEIYVSEGAAYDLFLTQTLQSATLLRSNTSVSAVTDFMAQPLDAVAGIRSYLQAIAEANPHYRVLSDSFNPNQQAIATPKANTQTGIF